MPSRDSLITPLRTGPPLLAEPNETMLLLPPVTRESVSLDVTWGAIATSVYIALVTMLIVNAPEALVRAWRTRPNGTVSPSAGSESSLTTAFAAGRPFSSTTTPDT